MIADGFPQDTGDRRQPPSAVVRGQRADRALRRAHAGNYFAGATGTGAGGGTAAGGGGGWVAGAGAATAPAGFFWQSTHVCHSVAFLQQRPVISSLIVELAASVPFRIRGVIVISRCCLIFCFDTPPKRSPRIGRSPKILALDNTEATIFVGESIRYARTSASSSQAGTLAFSVEEDPNSPVNVGFQLLVLPHVVPGENKIMLTVIPQQRALSGKTSPTLPGFDRFVFGTQTIDLPRVASSTLVTHMILKSGETAVIGGLLEDREIESRDKIPILGDLPLLGLLFSGTSKQKVKQHLLITITPRIIRGSDAANSTISDEMAGRCCKNAAEWETIVGGRKPPCAPPAPVMVPPPPPATPAPMPAPVPVAPTK